MDFGAKLRYRRLRQNCNIRELVGGPILFHRQFIQPIFVKEGLATREKIASLEGIYRDSDETILKQIEGDIAAGINKFLLFIIPKQKAKCEFSFDFGSFVIAKIKKNFGDKIWLAVDICLCSNTEDSHCGIINETGNYIINDQSVKALGEMALAFANAGSDCVAPSDMMDGRIGEIRNMLNSHGLHQTIIMSYSAKFASNFYGPFRDAAETKIKSGLKDRKSYQIDPKRANDAILSTKRDIAEGADIVIVKPATPYLDIVSKISQELVPVVVYQVSGECSSVELMAKNDLCNLEDTYIELWNGFARAGAGIIISYRARNAKEWLSNLK